MTLFLLKSHVRAHLRRTASGTVAAVREHDDSRTKKTPQNSPPVLKSGMEVAFRPEGGKKTRRGTIVGLTKHKARVQGLRDASGKEEVFTVDRTAVTPWDEYSREEKKDARYTAGDKAMARRVLTAKESVRRKVKGMRRLGMTEDEVLSAPYVRGFILKESATLAKKNGISPVVDRDAPADLWHRAADPEYADLIHEYALGALQSLRREAEGAPAADIKEFREHLGEKRKASRIFTTMMKHGETAAIRHLNSRKGKEEPVDIQSAEDDPDLRRKLDALRSEADQEHALGETAEAGIEKFLRKLPEQDADVIRRKFGLGDFDPHTNEQLADALNAAGSKYEGKYKWTRNHVGEAFAAAVAKLKGLGGIEELREFLKSLRERLEVLRKSHEKTICVDFDGVIADYSQGFLGKDIFGPPLPGAVAGMRALKAAGWQLVVHTSRPATPALADYLRLHEIPFDGINCPTGPPDAEFSGKPIADVYLDDRAVRFLDWEQARARILGDQPQTSEAAAACEGFHRKLKEAIGQGEMSKAIRLYSVDPLIKSLAADFPSTEVCETRHGLAVLATDALRKSFSSDLAKKYPGGRWITIKEGPLSGRHVFIVPHKDGSATVLAGGGPALRHKVLGLKKEEKKEESPPEEKKEAPPEKKEIPEEKRAEIETAKKEAKADIAEERRKMAEIVRTHLGKEVEITPEEKAEIEKKVAGIADPGKKAAERMKETVRLKREKDAILHQVAAEAKKAILEEEPTGTGAATIHAVVKEHAEDLLNHYYRIKALERQHKDLGKMLKTGTDKRPAADAVAFTPLSRQDLEGIVADEKARANELDAHYKLIATTRGYVDAQGKEHKAKGGAETERNIRQGGFEALTGILGEATGSSILSKEVYDEIGPQNAAALAHYYLKNGGHDVKAVAKNTAAYIEKAGGPVAQLAIERGNRFLDMARKAAEFGKGEQNLMSAAQALGTALKYHAKAFEAFGQAEGALNQGAELAYEFKNDKGRLEFAAGSRETLERKRRKLKLNKGDVSIAKDGDGYKMTVPSRAFEKMLHEAPTTHRTTEGLTPADIKAGKANTDSFRPTMLREYTPEDASGESRRIDLKPEQQAAARLIEAQKRVYLNFEAGTGKSLAIIAAKAHLEDATGKPKKTIIAMPQKLMANFKDEVEKFSHYKVAIVDDADKAKREAKYNSDPDTIVVVNKEKFNFDQALIRKAGFDMVAADEAHKVTQREGRGGSEMSKGLAEVAKGAEYYVAMSGTPTPNDLSELYFHANVIAPEKFSSQKEFMAQFGAAHKGVGFKEKIREFMNRELGDHVFTAKKRLDTNFTLQRHQAQLHPEQAESYRRASEMFRKGEISPLQRDQQLNTVLNAFDHRKNGKFAEVKKIVDEHLAKKGEDEKVIFYAKNYDTVDQIQDFLRQNYGHVGEAVTFTGREKVKDIRANKERFKHDPTVRFAIHTRAGVEGLNLQYDGNGGGATTAVAVASGEDSYAPLDQFFSRANRTGAKKDIHAHLVLTNTPHDMGTELRLDEKKGVGELIKEDVKKALAAAPGLFLLKSHVKEHLRRNKSGTVSVVKEHEDTREAEKPKPTQIIATLSPGMHISIEGKEHQVLGSMKVRKSYFYILKDKNGLRTRLNRNDFLEYQKDGTIKVLDHTTMMAKSTPFDLLLKSKYTPEQQAKIKKVMAEFKAGTLKSSDGTKVTDRKQAIAIALSQAGIGGKE